MDEKTKEHTDKHEPINKKQTNEYMKERTND